jgi:hypothetical protein
VAGAALALLACVLAPGPAVAQASWPVAVVFWSDVSCPDRGALVDALGRRGTEVVDAEQAALRLELGMRGADVAVTLRDRGGQVLAERVLPAGECAALADAIALLVERRVQGIDWEGTVPSGAAAPEVPPPPPPPPRAPPPRRAAPERPPSPTWLHAHAGVTLATELEGRGVRPGPVIGLRLLPPGLADVGLSFAWLRYANLPIGDAGSLDVDRFPIALSTTLALRRPRWEARAGASLEVDVLSIQSHLSRSASAVRAALRLGPTVELALSPFPRVWVGLGGALPIKVLGYALVVDGLGTVDRQARFAIEVGAWVGYRFRT